QSGRQLNLSLLFGNVSRQPGLANSYLASSSRGGAYGNAVKPDIAAPGANITSSFSGSGSGAGFFTGTSMSAPIVAGVLALLRQKYPNDTPGQLKARLYSTGKDVYSGANNGQPKHGTSSVGAGTVNAGDAVATRQYSELTATNIYGEVREANTLVGVPVRARFTNNSNSAQTYAVTYDRASDIPGLDLSFPSTVTVPANSGVDFQVIWSLNPANMKHTRDATVSATQSNNPRHWLSEETGSLLFTIPGSDQTIRLSTYFAARPASNMRTTQTSLNLSGQTGTIALGLTGQQVRTGDNFPTDEISIASTVELQGIDPNDSLTPPSLDFLDIQHIGVRSNFPTAGGIANTRLLFGVTTYGDWNSPNQFTANVFIDTNRDGASDYQLFNTSIPNAQGGPSDVFVTRLRNIATGAITTQFFLNSFSAAQFNTVPFNTNVMVLPVDVSALGLTGTDGKFNYEVKTSIGNVVVDSSGPFSYDALKPGLWFGGNTLIYFDLNNSTIATNYNLNDFRAANSEGALIIHHHNTRGNRAQVLPANLGREGDVAPRPSGNGSNTIADWTQIGRFVAGLDNVNLGNEFQRADVAPRTTSGNGVLAISDWVQAGRYAAGLDQPQNTGGPVTPTSAPPQSSAVETAALPEFGAGQARTLRALNANFTPGQANTLNIELQAQGGENALGFSLNYDPAVLTFVSADVGGGATGATLLTNTSQTANGRAGIALALPAGQGLGAGARRIVNARFNVAAGASAAMTQVSFGDQPVRRELADVNTNELTASYANAVITIGRTVASVSAASFSGTGLAAESIASAFGSLLATRVEVASSQPLPTNMAGTTVRVKDSSGMVRLSPLFFISPAQINYQIAPGTAPGPSLVTVTSGDGAVSMGNVNITMVAPGLFAANADGQGVAAAVVLRVRVDGSQRFEPVAAFDPARNQFVTAPIDLGPASDQVFLVLFGTGWRFRSSLAAVVASIGGINSDALFAGALAGFVGLDQLNLRLSRALIGRGEVDVSLRADGQVSNTVRIHIR
ncbi:MAG: S8 family serine peptidase, partial [Blastocatellia bacterium]